MDDDLMSPEEVARHFNIKPDSVRQLMRRHGIPLERGYRRSQVESIPERRQGYRSDLHEG